VLDDWRDRFDITFLIEDHAPKGMELVPFGSSLWLRWPEVGLALHSKPGDELEVGRWRGDRMPVDWPERLFRSAPWPWEGTWQNDTRYAGKAF
jgi:replicative DNA helicase